MGETIAITHTLEILGEWLLDVQLFVTVMVFSQLFPT